MPTEGTTPITGSPGLWRATAHWSAIGLGFSLPISVVLDNLFVIGFIAAFAATYTFRKALASAIADPLSVAALGVAAIIGLGMIWTPLPLKSLGKEASDAMNFALVALFLVVFKDATTRDRAIDAFLAASALVLLLSFLLGTGIVERLPLVKGNPDYPIVFKYHITHSFLLVIAVLLFILRARRSSGLLKVFCHAGAILAAINILFMIPGRTGQLALVAAALFFAYSCYRWRGVTAIIIACMLVALATWLAPTSVMHQRAATAWEEASTYRAEGVARHDSSIGLRLEFYRNTLKMVADHPILGSGTGAFQTSYRSLVTDSGMLAPRHPHNSFLLIAAELGLVGLGSLLALLAIAWTSAQRIPDGMARTVARAALLVYIVGGLFSATYTDHAEGLFFAWILGVLWSDSSPRTTTAQASVDEHPPSGKSTGVPTPR